MDTGTPFMADIIVGMDESGMVSVFEVVGDATAQDITAAMRARYCEGCPPHALWDYSKASFHRVDSAGYTLIAETAKALAGFRPGGRTAFVAPGEVEISAIALLEAISRQV
jgi:hypothetical protein